MKKSIFMLLLLLGSLVACTQSTDDNAQMRRDDMAPIEYSTPEGSDTLQQNQQDTARRLNNVPGSVADTITTKPYGTGTN